MKNHEPFTEADWEKAVARQFGKPAGEILREVGEFYDSLSPEDRKRVCFSNPMGHPYPSLLT